MLLKSLRVESDPTKPEAARMAKLTWQMDVVWTAATLLFLVSWILSIYNVVPIFEAGFLEAGFCNSPSWATQEYCLIFDWAAAVFTLLYAQEAGWEMNGFLGGALVYYIVHGAAHGMVWAGMIDPTDKIHLPSEYIALACILAVGPYEFYRTMLLQKTYPLVQQYAKQIALLMECVLVATYVFGIQKGVYALLYINTTIFLCAYSSRLLFLGYQTPSDIEARLKGVGPYVSLYIFAVSLVMTVMWIEPTMCSHGFAAAGGHVWFDASLGVLTTVGLLNANAHVKSSSEKEKAT